MSRVMCILQFDTDYAETMHRFALHGSANDAVRRGERVLWMTVQARGGRGRVDGSLPGRLLGTAASDRTI